MAASDPRSGESERRCMSPITLPDDNAQAESFIKTVKYEEAYRTASRSLEDERASIGAFSSARALDHPTEHLCKEGTIDFSSALKASSRIPVTISSVCWCVRGGAAKPAIL
jgi:hypothetical protein